MGSRRTERLGTIITSCIFALLAVLVVLSAFQLQHRDTDIFWALKSGEWIVSNWQVPATDPFSYTFEGREWVDFTWGFQVLAHYFYTTLGGWTGLFILQLFVTGATFALILLNTNLVGGRRGWLAASLLFLVFASSFSRFFIRPHLFAYLFLSAYFLILNRYERDGDVKNLFYLFPLQALWVNIHSSAVLGIFIIGAYAAGGVIDLLLKTGLKGGLKGAVTFPPRLWKLILASLVVPLASLINPYGLKLAIFPFVHQSVDNSDALRHINEWMKIPLKDLLLNFHPYPINFFAFKVLFFTAAVLLVLNYRRVKSRDLMIFAAAFYMASAHVRWVPLFAFFAAPVIAWNAASYMESRREVHPANEGRFKLAALLMSVFVAVFVVRGFSSASALGKYGLGIKNATFPEGTVGFMKRSKLKANIYNEYIFGGYIIYNLPENKVFIDGRTPTVYSPYFYWTSRLINDLTRWNRLVKEHEIDAAIVKTSSTFCNQLHEEEGWAAVYFDEVSVLYLRRGSGFDGMISERAFKKVNVCTDKGMYRLPDDEAGLLEARLEMRDFLAMEPSAVRFATAHRFLGLVSTELGGDYLEEALEEFKKAISINDDPYVSYDMGLALSKLKRHGPAIDAFRSSIARDRNFIDPYLAMGLTYFDIKDYESSVKTLDKYFLLSRDSSEHAAYKSHGMSCFWLSRFDCAVASLKRAAFTTESSSELGNLYYYIGNSLFETGDFDEGLKYYTLAIGAEPEYAAVLRNVADNLEKDGNLEGAGRLKGLLSKHSPRDYGV